MKNCSKCQVNKSDEDFYPIKGKRNKGLQSWCKECQIEIAKVRYQTMTFEEKLNRAFKRSNYTLSVDEYKILERLQEGKCAICGSDGGYGRLVVDHDHETGAVRGLLCSSCNKGLGIFEDDPKLLDKAAKYLRQN